MAKERVARILAHLTPSPGPSVSLNASSIVLREDGKLAPSTDPAVRALVEKYGRERPDGFRLDGLNHVAIVCSDMKKTVEFYGGVLGLRLVKTINLPDGGQHFFFDAGRGSALAFFWFPKAPQQAPGVSTVDRKKFLEEADATSGLGSINHICFNVPGDKTSPIMHHTNDPSNPFQMAMSQYEKGVYLSSIYIWGPDGELVEICAQWGPFEPLHDIQHLPADRDGHPSTV